MPRTLDLSHLSHLSHLSLTQRNAYILADNKLALNAGWDLDMLRVELEELKAEGFDLAITGFGLEENMADGAFRQFLIDAHTCLFAVMKPGAAIYVAHADTEGLNFRAAFSAAG